ncbi:MAG: YigZ family protein [Oscillospiraceae bacterium]|nr:YigZ family protein [Oscillospiraceae bacterium]
MQEYYIPTSDSETEFVEKRSRFIGHVAHVETEEEARAFITAIKKRYHDARHNCWCYVIRNEGVVRYSDDGEPQGTAGQPMLNVFTREKITDVVCVVTRYFGGILLGAGGLVRAYTRSAKDALDEAGVSVVRRWVELSIPCGYNLFAKLQLETESWQGIVTDTEYGADVTLKALLPEERAEDFTAHIIDITAGTVRPVVCGEAHKAVPVR